MDTWPFQVLGAVCTPARIRVGPALTPSTQASSFSGRAVGAGSSVQLTLIGNVLQQHLAQRSCVEDLCTFCGHDFQGGGHCGPWEWVLSLQGFCSIEKKLPGKLGATSRWGQVPEGSHTPVGALVSSLRPYREAVLVWGPEGWCGHQGRWFL